MWTHIHKNKNTSTHKNTEESMKKIGISVWAGFLTERFNPTSCPKKFHKGKIHIYCSNKDLKSSEMSIWCLKPITSRKKNYFSSLIETVHIPSNTSKSTAIIFHPSAYLKQQLCNLIVSIRTCIMKRHKTTAWKKKANVIFFKVAFLKQQQFSHYWDEKIKLKLKILNR